MFTLIASALAILIFRFYSLMILPLIVEASKTCLKKCVKCDHILEKQELLSLPSLTDNVLSFKCGGCAMVLSRKYAIVLTVILIIIYFFIPATKFPTYNVNVGGQQLPDVKWETFVEDCGRQALLNNGVRAKKNFETKYHGNIITWRGVYQSRIDHTRFRDPGVAEAFLIKMNPTDSKIDIPDLELIVPTIVHAHHRDEIEAMVPLDILEFKASFVKMGDDFQYHAFHIIEIKNTGEKFEWSNLQVINIMPQSSNLRKQAFLPPA